MNRGWLRTSSLSLAGPGRSPHCRRWGGDIPFGGDLSALLFCIPLCSAVGNDGICGSESVISVGTAGLRASALCSGGALSLLRVAELFWLLRTWAYTQRPLLVGGDYRDTGVHRAYECCPAFRRQSGSQARPDVHKTAARTRGGRRPMVMQGLSRSGRRARADDTVDAARSTKLHCGPAVVWRKRTTGMV